MKHAHVLETLLEGERIAPFAVLADPDPDPLPAVTRLQVEVDADGQVIGEWDAIAMLREAAAAMRLAAQGREVRA